MKSNGGGTAPAVVTVRRMTSGEFDRWRRNSIKSYAQELADALGLPFEDALTRARQQFADLLPAGLDTASTWLMMVVDESAADVGTLWVGPHPERRGVAYLYDIEIYEAERGRGLGRAALLAVERLVRGAGITEVGLSVFGFNEPARRLYDSLGYRVVATQLRKTLTSEGDPST